MRRFNRHLPLFRTGLRRYQCVAWRATIGDAGEGETMPSGADELRSILADAGSGVEFTGATVRALAGPVVYLWLDSDDRPLYVGSSRNGLGRAVGPRHHALRIAATDRLIVWPVASVEIAQRLERLLIGRLRPRDNVQFKVDRVAEHLGVTPTHVRSLATPAQGHPE